MSNKENARWSNEGIPTGVLRWPLTMNLRIVRLVPYFCTRIVIGSFFFSLSFLKIILPPFLKDCCLLSVVFHLTYNVSNSAGRHPLWLGTSFSAKLRSSRRIFFGQPDAGRHFGFSFFSRFVNFLTFSVSNNKKERENNTLINLPILH